MTSRDRMDKVLSSAIRSGFQVRQTESGAWHFRKGLITLIYYRTPVTGNEWIDLIETLRGAGMVWGDVDLTDTEA